MADYRRITVEDQGTHLEINTTDEELHDSLPTSEFEVDLKNAFESTHHSRFIISFAKTRSANTAPMNSCLVMRNRTMQRGGKLILCHMNKEIREGYRTLNLDGTVFTIVDTLGEARKLITQDETLPIP